MSRATDVTGSSERREVQMGSGNEIAADPAATDPEEVARRAVEGSQPPVSALADRLAAFSDPTRLELLIAIHAAPGTPVKTLAAATGLAPNTVSQALLSLRDAGLVENERDGRLSRWRLSDAAAHELLHHLGAAHSDLHPPH
jgi:ArsR family transcriptional regulator, lead/cadmium/zinc/bismuth-responsive transcriptional repressor